MARRNPVTGAVRLSVRKLGSDAELGMESRPSDTKRGDFNRQLTAASSTCRRVCMRTPEFLLERFLHLEASLISFLWAESKGLGPASRTIEPPSIRCLLESEKRLRPTRQVPWPQRVSQSSFSQVEGGSNSLFIPRSQSLVRSEL